MNKKKISWLSLMMTGGFAAGFPRKLDVVHHIIMTSKVTKPIKFAILADVHDTPFGKDMTLIAQAVKNENPDAVIFPGDLFQSHTQNTHSFELLELLKKYPLFYSTGNHEDMRNDRAGFLNDLKNRGLICLHGGSVLFKAHGNFIEIGGIDSGEKRDEAPYSAGEVNRIFTTEYYRILLSHQPHWTSLYKQLDCDLTLSGHAHGGQWCIPGTKQGLYSPNQGLFPAYTSGFHKMGSRNKLLISRGVTWHYHGLPKLYNNPEILIVTISPKQI